MNPSCLCHLSFQLWHVSISITASADITVMSCFLTLLLVTVLHWLGQKMPRAFCSHRTICLKGCRHAFYSSPERLKACSVASKTRRKLLKGRMSSSDSWVVWKWEVVNHHVYALMPQVHHRHDSKSLSPSQCGNSGETALWHWKWVSVHVRLVLCKCSFYVLDMPCDIFVAYWRNPQI